MANIIFNTDFEYDEWFEKKQEEKIIEDYFGKEVVKKRENGRSNINSD